MMILVTHNNPTGITEIPRRPITLKTTTRGGAQVHTMRKTCGTLPSAFRRSLHFAAGVDG